MTRDKILAIVLIALSLAGIVLNFISPTKKENANKDLGLQIAGGDKILSLQLHGVMMDGESQSIFGSDSSPSVKLRDQLFKAAKDKSVKGVILRINTPGGAVGISQEIYTAIKALREAKKPIIASMGDVAASGGYYIASGCDYIFANPGTLTGSIGVISHFMNLEGTYGKIGLKDMTIKAGKYKDIGSSSRPMTDEERKILQNLVNDTYEQFVTDVYEGRRSNSSEYGSLRQNLTRDNIAGIAQGMIYTGNQAKEIGLVDELGSYNVALEALQKLVKKRSNNKIKNDLQVVESLDASDSLLKGVFGMSGKGRLNSFSTPSQAIMEAFRIKNPILLLAPEFMTNSTIL